VVAGPTVNQIRVRRAVLLPPSFAATAVSYRNDGCLTLAAFYAQFVLSKHDSGVAAEAQMWSHMAQWFRLALTNNNTNDSVIRVVPVEPATPPVRMSLTNFTSQRIRDLLGKIGFGGPGLTNVAFQAGINLLRGSMTDNTDAYLEYDRQARRKTFAEKHGAALETRILRFTGQPDEAHLPEIHRLMTNAPRGREYSILNSQFLERACYCVGPTAHLGERPLGYPGAPGPSLAEHRAYEQWAYFGAGPHAVCRGLRGPR
jgi:hypothetical protein